MPYKRFEIFEMTSNPLIVPVLVHQHLRWPAKWLKEARALLFEHVSARPSHEFIVGIGWLIAAVSD